jgi:hypothetical protein
MYEPNKQDELQMKAYEDLGYNVWWNGYDIISDTTEDIRKIVISLVEKGWVKGE